MHIKYRQTTAWFLNRWFSGNFVSNHKFQRTTEVMIKIQINNIKTAYEILAKRITNKHFQYSVRRKSY